ncbi:hypothetical protein ACFC1R_25540 [Kitasatospora sp. NPDC056138]|uniref:hypothetical protein n=1 Tax=Kitasatospora sp. NPDC056138 TaxID=3345724 RepID=UPI0035D5CF53
MADSYSVDPNALTKAADGINNAIGELKTLGIDESAEVGRGFSNIDLSGVQVGHGGLHDSFSKFAERWAWGVRSLVQDGNEIAERLGLSAGLYHDQEQYVSGAMKDAVNAAMGNPDLTQEQVEKQSWSKTLSDNPYTQVRDADFSAESAAAATKHMKRTWQGEARDVVEHPAGLTMGLGFVTPQALGLGGESGQPPADPFGTRIVPPQQRTGDRG